MNVLFLLKVRKYSARLIRILYSKGYFGCEKSAQRYIDELFLDIEANLPSCRHKPAPPHFDRYGK